MHLFSPWWLVLALLRCSWCDDEQASSSVRVDVDVDIDGTSFTFHENISNAQDFNNYFQEYGTLYEQKRMLEDTVRMKAYHGAILGNAEYFAGKTVLDVGAGTGVLSMWVSV